MTEIDSEIQKLLRDADVTSGEKGFIKKEESNFIVSGDSTKEFEEKLIEKEKINKKIGKSIVKKTIQLRQNGNKVWNDETMSEWPENDYRIMVKQLPVDATDNQLYNFFKEKFKSCAKARVIYDSSGRGQRYGFVSFMDVEDYISVLKNMSRCFFLSKEIELLPSEWKKKNARK